MIYSSYKVFKNWLLLVTIMRMTREGVIFLGARVSFNMHVFWGYGKKPPSKPFPFNFELLKQMDDIST